MCGIFGVINATPTLASGSRKTVQMYDARKFAEQAFITSGVRGLDSSGVFQIAEDGKSYLHKLPVSGSLFIEDKTTKAFLADVASSPLTVCHVRAATEGRVHINNAHPFQVFSKDGKKSILGVHNGTLTGWRNRAGGNAAKYSVDSEWALAHIANEGADAFEDFGGGSFSFVWWEGDNPNRVMFARNKERPMHFVRTKDKKHVLFASEAGMLMWLVERNGIAVEDHVYSSDEDKMYSIDFTKEELLWKDLGFLPKKEPVIVRSSYSSRSGYENYYGDEDWFGYSSGNSYRDQAQERKENLIKALKASLKAARDSESIVEEAEEDGLLSEDYIQVADEDWFSDTLATYAERQMAKDKEWFGDVVKFKGELFDNQTFEIVGDVLDTQEKDVVYTGVMRNARRKDYVKNYRDTESYAVIIGAKLAPGGATEFILAPLTAKGRKEVHKIFEA